MTEKLLKTLPEYKYHGTIRASKIKKIKPIGGFIPLWGDIEITEPKGVKIRVDLMFLQKYRPQIGGYLVVDEDGRLYYSPEKPFEEGFSRINDISENGSTVIITDDNGVKIIATGSVTISSDDIVIQQKKIALEDASFSVALTWLKEGRKVARRGWKGEKQCCWLVLAGCVNFHDIQVPYGDHFVLMDAQNINSVWLPSVADLLACDWFVVE